MSRQRGGRKAEEGIFMGCRSSIQEYGGYPVHRSAKGRRREDEGAWSAFMNEEFRGSDLRVPCTCVLPPPLATPPSGSMISRGFASERRMPRQLSSEIFGGGEIYLRRYSRQLLPWERKNPWRNLMRRDCSAPRRATSVRSFGKMWDTIVLVENVRSCPGEKANLESHSHGNDITRWCIHMGEASRDGEEGGIYSRKYEILFPPFELSWNEFKKLDEPQWVTCQSVLKRNLPVMSPRY